MAHAVLEVLACVAIALVTWRWPGRWVHRALYRGALLARVRVNERVVARLAGPIALACGVIAWQIAASLFALPREGARTVADLGIVVVLASATMHAIDHAIEAIALRATWITNERVSESLLPLAGHAAKVAVGAVAAVMILAQLEIPIA